MQIVLWLIVGGLTGLIISFVLKTDKRATLYRNVLLGSLAGLASGWLTAPWTGQSETWRAGDLVLSPLSMLIALAGAMVVVLLVHFMRGSEERRIRQKTQAH